MYIVLEVQVNKDKTVGTLVNAYENADVAQQKYFTVLASASVSQLPKHSAFLLTEDGFIEHRCFTHGELENE